VSDASSDVHGLGAFEAIDLSQPLEEGMPVWPTLSRFFKTLWCAIHYGDGATAYQLVLNEHTGTHVDAPAHYMPPGHPQHRWVDEVPLERWMGRACLVGCETLEPRSAVSADHVRAWEARHGLIERGDIAVFEFGWWQKWALRPDDVAFMTDWPGLSGDCVELLLERGVKAVGVDTLSPDVFGDAGNPVHKALLGEGVVIVENLANLDRLPPRFYLLALPLKVRGGSGAPCRATALVPPASGEAH
jgi:kynurenine formamidase